MEIQGTAGASATIDRHDGFAEQLEKEYPDMEVIATQYCDYLREDAMAFMMILFRDSDLVRSTHLLPQ